MPANSDCGSRLPRRRPLGGREPRAAGRSGAIARAPGVRAHDAVHDPTHDRRRRAAPMPRRPSAGSSGPTSPTAELYEDAVRAGEGLIAAEGPLVVRTGKHTGRSPQDKFIVKEPGVRREDLVGRGQPADRPRALRPAPGPARWPTSPIARSTPRTASSAPIRLTAAASASTPRRPGRASSPGTSSAGRRPPSSSAFAPNFTIIDVPSFQADPGDRGHPDRHRDPREPRPRWRSSSSGPSTPARSRSRRSPS